MAHPIPLPELVKEEHAVHIAERPITFEQFLTLAQDAMHLELVRGVLEERMAAQLEHEWLFMWLASILRGYVGKRGLGVVLGSRTAVEINRFEGRLPDIVFVSAANAAIVQQKAIYGAPDLVIELVSPNDRPSDLIALEADYRSIGVAEIVFIDAPKRFLRVLHQREADYEETMLTEGVWKSEAILGLELSVAWILGEPRPEVFDVIALLLSSEE